MIPPHYTDPAVTLYHGDCLEVMRGLPDGSVDAVVTDPPYGLSTAPDMTVVLGHWLAGDDYTHRGSGFMGKTWDSFVPGPDVWRECHRVLKPGGHLLAFAGSRTQDLMGLAVRLAGFEIRDSIAWLYGNGFPKSLNVARTIASGGGRPEDIRRLVMGSEYEPSGRGRVAYDNGAGSQMNGTVGPVDLPPHAAAWSGWGTALKPAHEPIIVARKPFAGTVAQTVLAHGMGALNIDGCRVGTDVVVWGGNAAGGGTWDETNNGLGNNGKPRPITGRWPPNVVLDGHTAAELDTQSGVLHSQNPNTRRSSSTTQGVTKFTTQPESVQYADTGGASRFFPVFRYEAKAPAHERPQVAGENGLGAPDAITISSELKLRQCRVCKSRAKPSNYLAGDARPWPSCGHNDWEMVTTITSPDTVAHPTVKPLDLMRWLVRLVTPPGGTVLEPFAGSGTTAEAAVIEGFRCIAIEANATYLPLIVARLSKPIQPDLFGGAA